MCIRDSNNTAISNSNYALAIISSSNNTFINTSAISESGRGMYILSSNNNNFVNSSGRTYGYDYSISLFSSFNNTL